jgi:putative ABC transport system ATP-binding protein
VSESPLVEARDLYRFYHVGDDETLALRGVSLTVFPGEMVAIMGPSGSGKSTLLACLGGLDDPDGGCVSIGGERITRRPEAVRAELRARHIGMLMQAGNLLGHLSVAGNVRMQQLLAWQPKPPAITALLASVGIADRAHAYPDQLSGGEAARAGLAVALAHSPHVLLADEPTGEVDAATEDAILALLRAYANEGRAVVLGTHSAAAARRADRRVLLRDGAVVAQGP